jgi:endoglucanase
MTRLRTLLLGMTLLAATASALAATTPGGPGSSNPTIKIADGQFVDGSGAPLQLRGVNVSNLEFAAIQGWGAADPWGGGAPSFSALKSWKLNAIRVPLNEASWLGLTTFDFVGKSRKADPGNNYQATVKRTIADATAAGLYVVLDLHWSAPNLKVTGQAEPVPFSPLGQAPMADADHSLAFWTSVASTFKNSPNVVFDLFNEPYTDSYGLPFTANAWTVLLKGGAMSKFPNNTSGGANFDDVQEWTVAGMQQMVKAVRETGATNVIITAGVEYAKNVSQWLKHVPLDPLKQLACSIHLYPTYGSSYGTKTYDTIAPDTVSALHDIQAAGYPILVGETGGRNAPGTKGDQFVSNVLDWADANKASVFGWTWNVWQNGDFVLIKDAAGTPTDGYGQVFKKWAVGHAP